MSDLYPSDASDGDERRGGRPESIDAILRRVQRTFGPARRKAGVADLWSRVAGPDLCEVTRAVAVRKGEVIVEARSAALVHELQGFRRDELLAHLMKADGTGRVRGLRFRLGVF